MLDHLRAISLDAMGTLIELRVHAQSTYYQTLRALGHDEEKIAPLRSDPGRFRRYWRDAEARLPARFLAEHRDRFHNYPDTPYAFWGLIFEIMFHDLELDSEQMLTALETAYQRFAKADLWRVEPTFSELAEFCSDRGIPLYVTSNWDLRLPSMLEQLGLARYFAGIITSAQVGYEKPSKKIFAHLIAAAGCDPAEILHVGDSLSADVQGAQQSGLRTVLFSPNRAGDSLGCPVVNTLNQLIAKSKTDFFR
jgi:REG-2-like HAD superfamily hydrolase